VDRQKLLDAVPTIERYAATVLAVVCTVAIRLTIDPMLGGRAPYMLFILVVVVLKRFWGRGPAALATLLWGIAAWYFIVQPPFSFTLRNPFDALNLAGYFAVGFGISLPGDGSSRWPASRTAEGKNIKLRVFRQTAVLVGAAVILASMVLLLLRDFRRTQEAQGSVSHTYEVISSAASLRSAMEDAGMGERRFLQTGDVRDLAYYNAAMAAVPRVLKELKDLTADSARQQARCAEVKRLTDERLAVLNRGLELRATLGADAALAAIRSDEGLQSLDSLRSTVDAVMREEHDLLAERTARAADEASRGYWVLGLGSSALIILLVLATMVIERETVRREEITQALRRHAGLLEQAHESLLICQVGGVIGYWNRGAETLFGYTREEAVGRFSHELLKTEHPLGMARIDDLLERNGQWKGELAQTTKDGRRLVVEAHWTVAVDARGNKAVLEANRDITERKRAEETLRESEQRYRQLFGQMTEAFALLEPVYDERGKPCDGRYLEANPAFEIHSGLPRTRVLGRTIREVFPDIDPFWIEAYEKAATGEPVYFEKYLPQLGKWFEVSAFRAPQCQVGVMFTDITERKRAEAQNLLLAAAIEQAAETVVITDRDAKIQYVNPAFTRTTGYARAEVMRQSTRILKSGHHGAKFYHEMWATLTAGKIWRGEFTNRRKDGSLYTEEATIAPVRDASGETINYIAIKSDITERKRGEIALRESEMMLRFFVQHAPAAIAMLDREMRYLVVSERWMSDFRLGEGDIRGLSHYDVFPEVPERWKEVHRRCVAGAVERCQEDPFPRTDGSVDWVSWEARPWRRADDSIGGIIIFSELITERKQAEMEIRLLNAQLEQRVRQRTAELETANRELEAFAYSVSHDLRAPLRGIDGWSMALVEDYAHCLDAQGHQYLDRVRSEAQRMGMLIDDLLQLSRFSRGDMVLTTVDLTALAGRITARLKEAHPDRCIEFVIAPQLQCVGDARLLEVALTNLLDNAVKFTGQCTMARVEVGETVYEGSPAFFVRDNGAGFDMAYAQMLFAPFQRLHKATDFPGTGIGLATVQRVIHRLGGRIWAEARVGAGATLYFTLGENKE